MADTKKLPMRTQPITSIETAMYSADEYKKAASEETEIIPEIPSGAKPSVTDAAALDITESDGVIKIAVNGKTVKFDDAQPFVDANERTQIPIRAVAETLGAKVDWNDASQTAVITKGDSVITVTIGKPDIQANGKTITMDTVAQIINDRTYIPVRFVGEALGMTVNWASE